MVTLASSLWSTSTADYGKNHNTEYLEKDIEKKLKALAEKAESSPLTEQEQEKAQQLIQNLSRMRGHAENSQRIDNYVELFANAVRYGSTWVSPVAAGITSTLLDKPTKRQYNGSLRIRKARQTGKGQPRRSLPRKKGRRKVAKVNHQESSWLPDANSIKVGVIAGVSTYCFNEYITPMIWSAATPLLDGVTTAVSSLTEQYIGPIVGMALSNLTIF